MSISPHIDNHNIVYQCNYILNYYNLPKLNKNCLVYAKTREKYYIYFIKHYSVFYSKMEIDYYLNYENYLELLIELAKYYKESTNVSKRNK